MLNIDRSKRFIKSYELCARRNYNMNEIKKVMELLIRQQPLPRRCKSHKLHGRYVDYWECHIKGDWILIYRYVHENNLIIFEDTGTHSDLF